MTWLSPRSISSTASAGTTLPFGTPVCPYEPYAESNGTVSRRPLSWRGWKNRLSTGALFGIALSYSQGLRGVAKWISSLPDSHVSRSPTLARCEELTMIAGAGQVWPAWSLTFDRASYSWRIPQALSGLEPPSYWETLPNSGSMRSGVCWEQPPLEPPISAIDGGFSPGDVTWPTPMASIGDNSARSSRPSKTSSSFSDSLHEVAFRLHLQLSTSGNEESTKGLYLNPLLVERLMGLPDGWSNPSEPVATASSPPQQALRSSPSAPAALSDGSAITSDDPLTADCT